MANINKKVLKRIKKFFKEFKFPLLCNSKNFILQKYTTSAIVVQEKITITLLYLLPYLSISFNTNDYIEDYYPNLVNFFIPYGTSILSSNLLKNTVGDLIFVIGFYFLSSSFFLSGNSLFLTKHVQMAFISGYVIELSYLTLMSIWEVLIGIHTETDIEYIDYVMALFPLFIYVVYSFCIICLYIVLISGKLPIIHSQHPLLYFPKKVIDSLLFSISLKKKKNKK